MSFWKQTIEIARTDLSVERRLGDTFKVVLPFSIMALLVFPLTLGGSFALLSDIGFAVFWALSILFGMQVALRQSVNDSRARRDLYALVGVDPAAKFIGRCLSGTLLMVGFLVILFVAMLALFNTPLPEGNPLPGFLAILLFAVGTTALSTLAGELTNGLRNRSALAPLLVAPLSVPLVFGASQAWESIGQGGVILSWILVLVTAVLALIVVGVAVARTLEESAQ